MDHLNSLCSRHWFVLPLNVRMGWMQCRKCGLERTYGQKGVRYRCSRHGEAVDSVKSILSSNPGWQHLCPACEPRPEEV
jgi:hypothetical protein